MKHRIGIFLGSKPDQGGAFQYSLSILAAARSFPEDKFEVIVAYSENEWQPYLTDFKNVVSIPIDLCAYLIPRIWRHCRLPTGIWRKLSLRLHPVATCLSRLECDLWIFPSQDDWGYMAAVPALVSIHDLMHRFERRFAEVSANLKYYRREHHYKNICNWSRGILTDSLTGRQHVIDSYPVSPGKVHVLPYVAPRYMLAADPEHLNSEHLPLPDNYIFYPAQFWEHKNHKNLIYAVSRLKPNLPDLNVVLVGSPKNGYKSLRELVMSQGLEHIVHFLGYVPDEFMPHLYRRARAMIMPTFFGPTNIPPLEAFAAGCPAAVSNIYGMPEQVGDAALLFDPNSITELAATIVKLWTDPDLRKDLSRRGLHKFRSWNQSHFNLKLLAITNRILQTGDGS